MSKVGITYLVQTELWDEHAQFFVSRAEREISEFIERNELGTAAPVQSEATKIVHSFERFESWRARVWRVLRRKPRPAPETIELIKLRVWCRVG